MPTPPPGFELDPVKTLPAGFTMDQPETPPPEETATPLSEKYAQYRTPEAEKKKSLLDLVKEDVGKAKEIGELTANMAFEAGAVPVSGIAGLSKYITTALSTGDIDKALAESQKTMTGIQEAASEIIPAESGKEKIAGAIETAMKVPGVKPAAEFVGSIPEKIGDVSYEGALAIGLSPQTASSIGAIGATALPATLEILGAKTTPVTKKGFLDKLLKKVDKTDLYDEFGMLKNEVKTGLKDAGIGLEDVADVLPESITTMKAAEPLAQQIKGVKSPKGGKSARLAETFQPDIEKIKAFEDLDIEYLPQHVSNNPTAAAIAENLKDIPGSLMADREKRIVQQLADKADEIIKQGGGTIEKGELATRYINESQRVIDDLAAESEKFYKRVGKAMPGKTPVETENIVSKLNEIADNMGGVEFLSAQERRLLKSLSPEAKPTYGRLDQIRRQIGEQLGGKDTVFRNADRKNLGDLYDALTNDQETALLRHGNQDLLETYLTGKYTTAQRKGIERQLKDTLGKKMTGDITKKMGSAVKGLATGDTRTFDTLLSNIPGEVGADLRRDLVTSALNDAFLAGARGKDKLSIGGFGSYWKKLNRQPKAMQRLKKELSPDTWKRLNTLATVNDALKQTMELSVRTGRQLSTPGLFDEVNNIAKRAYGAAKTKVSKIPGAGFLTDVANLPKNARSIAADELLSDRRFLNMLKQEALGKVDTATKRANINKIVNNIQSFKNWKKYLPKDESKRLAKVGALGYFFGSQDSEEEQTQ